MRASSTAVAMLILACGTILARAGETSSNNAVRQAEQWRAEHRTIDLHMHVDGNEAAIRRAVKIMDAAGVGIGVNLSGGTVTKGPNGEPSAFEKVKALSDQLFPGRFLFYMNLDYRGWDSPDFSERAAAQVEEGFRLGAAGLKEYKRLGLGLRDGQGRLIKVDDPKLDAVWKRCGELGMPISIHVGDPKAFWEPFNDQNERWKELRDHRPWWFGDSKVYPPRMDLLEGLDRVIARHKGTTFVCVHFANNPEDIDWVDKALTRNPNMMADLAARMPEVGRHDPKKVHDFFMRHQNRILFATDFMVYDKLILGSSGDAERPTDEDALTFYRKEWRWLETWDRNWEHMTPIQGDWTINSIGLPSSALRNIYFDNARRLLARSLPAPKALAAHITHDFKPDGNLGKPQWLKASPVVMEYGSLRYDARPELATTAKLLWSGQYLYLSFDCPFTKLTVFEKQPGGKERMGLWDRDVVEAFIGDDPARPGHYAEIEVAPTNERLDVMCDLPAKDFGWDGGVESAVKINKSKRRFTVEMRIPFSKLSATPPKAGAQWRLNLYRCDKAGEAALAWSPVLKGSFHTPEKFGTLEFVE